MLAQIQTTLVAILATKKQLYNDKCIVSISLIIAFLNTENPDALFSQHDNIMDTRISLGIKFGLLMNGNVLPNRQKLVDELEKSCLEKFNDMSGLFEIDAVEHEEAKEEFIGGQLFGALDIIGFLGDIYLRRFALPADSLDLYSLQFRVVNKSSIFSVMNEAEPTEESYYQILNYLESIPVKQLPDGKFDKDLM
jgi:hypothetical protein